MGKRGNGEGSIYRRKDGRWAARYSSCVEGRTVWRWIYAQTRDEAGRRLREALTARDAGTVVVDPSQTLATFLATWLEATKPSLRARSWERYEEHVRLYLTPTLGRLRLAGDLRPEHVQRLYAGLLAKGVSPSTVPRVHAALHRALAQAVRWRLVWQNVADLVDPPAAGRKEMKALTASEVRTLLEAAKGRTLGRPTRPGGDPWRAARRAARVEMAGHRPRGGVTPGTGLPLGRARAAGLAVTNPKTARSRRRVELTATAVGALQRHRAAQAAERLAAGPWSLAGDLVFTNSRGGFLGVRSCTSPITGCWTGAGVLECASTTSGIQPRR